MIPIGKDRDAAKFVFTLKTPHPVEGDDAEAATCAGVGFLRAFSYPQLNLGIAELWQAARRTVQPDACVFRRFVFNDALFITSLAGYEARLIGLERVTAIAAVRAVLRDE